MSPLFAVAYVWMQVLIPGKSPNQQFGINDKGQTVVTTDDGASGIYDHGSFTPLPPPPASCACKVDGTAVNNAGVVVGIATPIAGGPEQGFVLSGGTYTFFSWAGWQNTEPRGIGNQGLVVGWAFNSDNTNAGFVFDPFTGTFTNVTPGSGFPSIVQGLNRLGRVAGTFVQPSPRKLFGLISQFAPTATFGSTQVPFASQTQLGGAATRARGINDFGVTVGFVAAANGGSSAYTGSDTLGYEIVVPPGGEAPDASSICTGINNLGQVACAVADLNFNNTRGLFIGTPAR